MSLIRSPTRIVRLTVTDSYQQQKESSVVRISKPWWGAVPRSSQEEFWISMRGVREDSLPSAEVERRLNVQGCQVIGP